jgi:hypothetical protein
MEHLNTSSSEKIFTVPTPFDDPGEADEQIHDNLSVIKFPDGSAVLGPSEDEQSLYPNRINVDDHHQNLANVLSEDELRDIGNSLKYAIEDDIKSQEPFFEAVAKTIKFLGLSIEEDDDGDDLPFKGASTVYSSAMFESILDLVASGMANIFPSSNMVDTVVLGEASDELQNVAYRKKQYFNHFFDDIAKDFRKESKRTLMWSLVAGWAYKKVFICPVLGRPTSLYIPVEDFIVNREHSSHYSSTRKTHILRNISERELKIRIMAGIYRDIDIMKSDNRDADQNPIVEQLDQIAGYEAIRTNQSKSYTIYESHCDYRIKGDPAGAQYDLPLPYRISLESQTGKILSLYRNWDKDDFFKKKKEFFVCYPMLPSLDGEGYGAANYALKLAEAATCIERQLINAATYANFPGGVYQSGIRIENNNLRPAPAEFVPIQTGGIPISQAIMPLPYKEPSSALHDLKNEIEDNIRKPGAIINQKVSELAPRAPQGSVLAILENLQKVPNLIMQGWHEALTSEYGLYDERFYEWFPANKPYSFIVPGGQHVVMKSDFGPNIQVRPSSDPSKQNSTHRFMLSEIVINNVKESPQIHNVEYAYRYFYKNLGLAEEDINRLLSPQGKEPKEVPPLDPVSTMMAIMQGQPVNASVWQDHDAYITILDIWMQANQNNPNLPAAQALKAQHEAFKYLVDVYSKLNIAPPENPSQLTPDQQNELAVAVAQIKTQEAQQAAEAAGPPPEPPLDPAKVMLEDSQLKAEMAHEKHMLEAQKLELDRQKLEMEYALKEQQFNLESQVQGLKQTLEEQKAQIESFKVEHEQLLKERDQAFKELEHISKQNNVVEENVGY